MADQEQVDKALGEEAVRRGLLTGEHLAEARQTQQLAVQAGLPITLAEVLIQRQYLNQVQIETLQRRMLEQPQAPVSPPQAQPAGGMERPQRAGDSTRSLPRQSSTRGSTTGPSAPIRPPSSARAATGPFPAVSAMPAPPPAPALRPPSERVSMSGPPAAPFPAVPPVSAVPTAPIVPEGTVKRASGRAPAVSSGSSKRGSSISTNAVSPVAARPSALSDKRGSSRAAAVPPATSKRASSIAAEAVTQSPAVASSPPSEKRASARRSGVPPVQVERASSIASDAISPAPLSANAAGSVQAAKPSSPAPAVDVPGAAVAAVPTTAAPVKPGATTAETPPIRSRTSATPPAARPERGSSKTVLWVILVLLLLAGSNTITWMVATGDAPVSASRPQPMACGPSFDPLAYWLVSGPFPAKSAADLDTVHEPERSPRDVTASLKGATGPLKWKLVKMQSNLIPFDRELGTHTNCNGYGLTYVECPSDTKALLGIGSDDAVRVWLNGKMVHQSREQRGCVVDQDRVSITLCEGVNEIFIKVGQGTGEWGFAATLRAPDGKPLPGLKGCLPKEIAIPEPPKTPVPAKKAATPATKTVTPPVKPTAPATKPAAPTNKPAAPTPPPAAPPKSAPDATK